MITHPLSGIIGFRMLMIASGYEDSNDASPMRSDPMFTAQCPCIVAQLAMERLPGQRDLCPQPTISRLETSPIPGRSRAWAGKWLI